MIRVVVLLLGSLLLATPAHATSWRVDASSEGSTNVRCRTGTCACSGCHAGQPNVPKTAPLAKAPKHDRAFFAKHLFELAEGKKLKSRGDSYITKEKGQLVLYEGKKRTVLPASTFIVKDDGGRAAVVIEE